MDRATFLYKDFLKHLDVEPTPCQDAMLRQTAAFVTGDDADILVVNGYAGTGKTTAIAAVIDSLSSLKVPCVLLAPTGRSAKVLSGYAGRPAQTIHKGIYRQKSVGDDGFGQFSLTPNKARSTLFVVDEVSLIGIEGVQQGSGGAHFGSGNLLEDLVTFVRNGSDCRLILIGDSAQLPPVGMEESPALSPDFMEGFGGGMGGFTETCGALSGAVALVGYASSNGPNNPVTKKGTYKQVAPLVERFRNMEGSTLCGELTGLAGGPRLQQCPKLIEDGVRLVAEHLG